jgi:hypothetical protein
MMKSLFLTLALAFLTAEDAAAGIFRRSCWVQRNQCCTQNFGGAPAAATASAAPLTPVQRLQLQVDEHERRLNALGAPEATPPQPPLPPSP